MRKKNTPAPPSMSDLQFPFAPCPLHTQGHVPTIRLRVEGQFHAAHYLENYIGKCSNLHGHTWKVVAWVQPQTVMANGIGIDFGILKNKLNDILPDHQHLNRVYRFNPTAENIAKRMHEQYTKALLKHKAKVISIEVWETDKNCAVYSIC